MDKIKNNIPKTANSIPAKGKMPKKLTVATKPKTEERMTEPQTTQPMPITLLKMPKKSFNFNPEENRLVNKIKRRRSKLTSQTLMIKIKKAIIKLKNK